MNDPKVNERKLQFMAKSSNLQTKEFEEYLHNKVANMGYSFKLMYDVMGTEVPYFDTLQYTEFAGGITMHPIQTEFRHQQMIDAYYSKDTEVKIDFVTHFKKKVLQNKSNKYMNINQHQHKAKQALIVLPGSNKLKDRMSFEKLKYIKKLFGDNVWVKPHPLTTFSVIGIVQDMFGERNVMQRQADLYSVLKDSEIIYTSMLSESALYGVCLDKKIEPIDLYGKIQIGSFYHINKFLFYEENPKQWINKTFNDYRSGMVFPEIDPDWKTKVDKYLEYIEDRRQKFWKVFLKENKK